MANGLKVGVIGASGIGQHHARWHALCGSEVVGFVGTSTHSVARTRKRLADYFGFEGRGYTSVTEMLEVEAPDIVAVTSPYSQHHTHVYEALSHGAHVLCEKPLFWDEDRSLDAIAEEAGRVVRAAQASGRLFGMTAQYPASLPMYRALYEEVRGPLESVSSVTMEMEVKRRGDRKLYEANWIDVASHPLSLVIAAMGRGAVLWETATCAVTEAECRAGFAYRSEAGTAEVSLTIRDIVEGAPIRRFGLNGFLVDWDGFPDENGVYRASLSHGEKQIVGDDFLHTLIRSFTVSVLEGEKAVVLGPEEALLNLEMQVDLLRLARDADTAA